ncbi:bifunctional non-homologous end joining protein LigD [Microbacterium resistens]|uniref:DNA ligase (ATP) n=1 Tax=Microbacterium resistens TaxID=156977 RepID=A0ABU1S793_9MICO|nr:ATP-dependent DNA ligase [Microbacterium resistens]MDR6865465.1 bifunctional non-homologous end joining protein LigD [Microbacterium resistens]
MGGEGRTSDEAQIVHIDGRRLRISNLGKVVYPETGTTKGEIIDYYARIAPAILPGLARRPVTRKRWVEGVGTTQDPAEAFFAKQLERGAPSWISRLPIEHSGGAKDYPLVEDVATLVWLAQVAAIELHVPQWRFGPDGERLNPDRLVLDLDPGPGADLAQCAAVARLARPILEGMGLAPVPVTSGSKGIHLYAALSGGQSSDAVSAVAHELARAIEADHPDIATSTMSKAVRTGRVFIDWSQNNGKKTTIAPYSLRGRPQPWVAAPRTWDELNDPGLRQLSFDDVLQRFSAGIDPLGALASAHVSPALAPYVAKRDASRTPEPMPSTAPPEPGAPRIPGTRRFVIQQHHARRLHFDLRIEDSGVLVSWAVPKGVPETPDRNHLAVMTEPHPLEYLTFAGTIPRGEYGAGEMTVWDTGTVTVEKWRDNEVIGTFTGRPGGPLGVARLALIRTGGEGEKSSWLLHRMTGRPERRRSPSFRPTPADASPETPAGSPSGSPAGSPSSGLSPMLAEHGTPGSVRALGGWAEIKWDGIRAIGTWRRDGTGAAKLTLRARSGTDITDRYPELTADGAPHLTIDDAVVDGEIIALDHTGRPSFTRLQARMHLTRAREIEREVVRVPVRYHLFDLLRLDGHDLTRLPLRDRRELLERIVEGCDDAVVVPPVFDDADAALATSARLGLEGIVVKDPASPYLAGQRTSRWLKIKHTRMQEAVIVGIRPGKGDRAGRIGSLLLAVPDPDAPTGLRYAGRVGTGFTDRELDRLGTALDPLRTDLCPVDGVPQADASDARWILPRLVGEVEFANWTPDRILRHARWRGLRSDKAPGGVVLEP